MKTNIFLLVDLINCLLCTVGGICNTTNTIIFLKSYSNYFYTFFGRKFAMCYLNMPEWGVVGWWCW